MSTSYAAFSGSPEAKQNGPVYQIENLTKRYGKGKAALKERPANDNISLQIEPGEVFGLLGSNGAGKSTLIRQMVNLLAPSSGRICLFGQDIARKPEMIARYVAYMPQKPQALLDLTAEEAIYFTGHLRGMRRAEAKKEAARLVDEWGLGEVRNRAVRHLSGGQHRLIGLAISLIGNLPVLILDEPTNELDPAYRKQVWERLIDLNRSQGTTIILVTHNVQEAERVIERVAVMSQGKVVGLGRVGELKEQTGGSVRLELFLKPETVPEVEVFLSGLERASSVRPGQWNVFIPRQGAEDIIHRILSGVRLERLEDFRVHTPTLEDVYMALTGRAIAEEEVTA
jgi:ABC-type multidrug transport system ATPase subunit